MAKLGKLDTSIAQISISASSQSCDLYLSLFYISIHDCTMAFQFNCQPFINPLISHIVKEWKLMEETVTFCSSSQPCHCRLIWNRGEEDVKMIFEVVNMICIHTYEFFRQKVEDYRTSDSQ